MSDIPTQQREIGGLKARFAVAGDGPPILFLHGWGQKVEAFWPPASRLANKGYTVHVPDLPGFGDTEPPPQPWAVKDYMEWVLAYMDAQNLQQVFLIGHSFGGRISLMLAAEHSNRLIKIALSNSAGVKLPPPPNIRFYYAWRRVLLGALSLPGLGGLKERTRNYLRQRYGSTDYLNAGPLLETFKLVIAEDMLPFAKRVPLSTLLFWGDQDDATPLQAGKILEREMQDAGLVVYEGAGHYAYLDRLEDFVNVVDYFFQEQSEAS